MMDGGCFVAPTNPPRGSSSLLHQKAPSRKGGGSFLTKYFKTEREGYSHFVRDCEAYPPEAYAPTNPPLRVLIPFTPKSPQPQRRWELSYEVSQNGERGIRTLAPLTQSNPLAEGPLIATWVSLQENGSPNRTRTCDNSINSRVLYQLSYQGTLLYGNTK